MLDINKANDNVKPGFQAMKVIKNMLNQAGIIDYDAAIIQQLLYYMYNRVTNVLENAEFFSKHANKTELDKSDVSLALLLQKENDLEPISRQIILELTDQKNSSPLPEIQAFDGGLRLPPEKYCLSNTNYKMKMKPKVPVPMIIQKQVPQNTQYLVSAENNPATLLKKNRITNMAEQKFIFRPRLKLNIKSVEEEFQVRKKQRTN